MARRENDSHTYFSDDPRLQQYFLDGVYPTGKELGRGSYGSVVEVKYQRKTCAAKELHEILLDPGNQGVEEIVRKYQRECQLMASISHPNLTQFLGLCFLGNAHLPLLVMERLEMSLDELLSGALKMSLLLKISLLHGTCNGLVHLHSRRPPIVHRDLTARNVLISSSMTAKIADFGCSRMTDMRSGQVIQTMSKLPGTLVYMPPEALDGSHRYGPSLDVFSFGHLSLYAIIQNSPDNLLSVTYPDPNNKDHILARSEVDRRQPYMATLETQVAQSYPNLLELVQQCLHNAPERRPSSKDVLRRLQEVKNEEEGEIAGNSKHDVDKDQLIEDVLARNSQLEAQNSQLEARNSQLEAELGINSSDKKQTSITKTSAEVEPINTCPLHLDWEPVPDMPLAMSGNVYSVEVDETIYVGGGMTATKKDELIVMAFNTTTSSWHTLPPYSVPSFAMTTINKKLVLVGGWHDGHNVDHLGVWQTELNKWIYPFPPMNTARQVPSATSYKRWIVVAGGYDGIRSMSSVEVLDVDDRQWSTSPSTPTPCQQMKSTIIGDTWYLMGGKSESYTSNVYSISLECIVSHSSLDSSWRQLASLNCIGSSPLSIKGSLLAVGGLDNETRKIKSTIQRYISKTNTWVQTGTLPSKLCFLTCIATSDAVYVMGGGSPNRHDNASTYVCKF